MRFNAAKCNILSLRGKRPYLYQLDDTILDHVDAHPYLGVELSKDLKWSNHISKVTNCANRTLGFLRRNLGRCPKPCKKTAYIALVRSVLEYSTIVWDPYLVSDIDRLERIQTSAPRFITARGLPNQSTRMCHVNARWS